MNRIMLRITCILLLLSSLNGVENEAIPKTPTVETKKVFSVADCIAYGVTNNVDVRKSRIAMQKAEWQVISQKAKYAFQLNSSITQDIEEDTKSYNVNLNRTLPMDFNVRVGVTKNETGNEGTASLRISKVILGGGTLAESNREIQNSLIDELTTQNGHYQRIRQLKLQVVRAYYRVVRSKQTLDIQRRQLDRAKQNKVRAVERDRLLDIANADIQVSENEDRVLQAELDITSAKDNLKRVIGMRIDKVIDVSGEFSITITKNNLIKDWEFAQKNHVDFVNYYLDLKKIERDIKIERSQLLPTVTLDYNASQASNETYDFEQDVNSSIGLSLSWTFGAARDRSTYHRALLDKQSADIDLFDITQRKLLELRNLDRDINELIQRIGIAEARLKLQERSTALYADRWQNGEIDILEFIRNQDALENSRVSLLQLKIQYIEKLEEYNFAIGR